MTNPNDPAFPVPDKVARDILEGYGFPADYLGLTKREYFAAMAMEGFLSSYSGATSDPSPHHAALKSVAYADALIESLNKIPNS